MGLIAVASAKGAPGVTTTALLLGALWPRPSVVAECDPSGGDVAYRIPSSRGEPLDPQHGLLSLIAAGRRSFHPGLVAAHAQTIVGGLDVVTGVSAPEQGLGISRWPELGQIFAAVPGVDVLVDLGRVGPGSPQSALLADAAAVLFVVDTVPSSVLHLRERLSRLHAAAGAMAPPMYVAVVAPPKRRRAVEEVREVLDRSDAPVDKVFHLAFDPAGAGFFLGQVHGNPSRTALVRSAQPIAEEVARRTEPHFVVPAGETDQPSDGQGDEE